MKTGLLCTFPRTELLCQSSHAFCYFLFLLSGLATSPFLGIKMRKGEVQVVASSFTSVYFSQNWDFFHREAPGNYKTMIWFLFNPLHKENKAGGRFLET